MGTLLAQLPHWASIAIAVVLTSGMACLIHAVIRWKYRHETLRNNNEVAGFNYAVLGVVYSVLLAFMTMAVYEEYKEGRNSIRVEAGAIVNLHHIARGLPEPVKSQVRAGLVEYAASIVKDEWSLMGRGLESRKTISIMTGIRDLFITQVPDGYMKDPIFSLSLTMLDDLYGARQARVSNSQTMIPGFMWFVLIAGAAITISFTFFFGAPNFAPQVMMTAMLSIMIVLILLLIVHLDNPFLGPVSVSAEPYLSALREMKGN